MQPHHLPGFAFSWLQLYSHRLYLPLLLSQDSQPNGWTICFKLVSAHLSFLQSILIQQNKPRKQSEKAFYQGTLRFLVVLLHDYPEFLCRHYLQLIQLLPSDCIQLRNVILSSFPRDMILPDPFTTTLGYMATNTCLPPTLFTEEEQDAPLKDLDTFLTGGKSTMGKIGKFVIKYITTEEEGDEDVVNDNERIQRLVFYLGTRSKLDTTKSLSENPAIQIYKYLSSRMPSSHEQHILINAIVDHLRYPNSHTYFFSMTLLQLFATQSEFIKELITR